MKYGAKIYQYLPVGLQNLAISSYGLFWKSRRFGGIFADEYRAFREREQYTVDQWQVFQTTKLREMLVHAFSNVPFYKDLYQAHGFTLTDLQKFELSDLVRLPYVTKNDIRIRGTGTMLSAKQEHGGQYMASSGTSGTPTKIKYSHAMHQRIFAAYESRVRNWAGVTRFMTRASIGGRRILPGSENKPPYYRYNSAERQVYLSAYHISKNTVQNYVDGIVRYGVEYMTGYAMSNYFLARFIEEAAIEAPQMRATVLSSEKLTPDMRALFLRVYGCKSYDGWSGVENCALVSESEYGQLLVSPDVGILELLDNEGSPIAPGETGEVVCTGFLNYDQPLIRYRIGDYMTLSKNQHTLCGRNMPIISDIEGRSEDTVIGPDGREMVRFHGIFINLPSVVEAQLIQHDQLHYTINVVTTGKLAVEDRTTMIQRMHSQLGGVEVEFCEMAHIPRGANGKFKAVISHLNR